MAKSSKLIRNSGRYFFAHVALLFSMFSGSAGTMAATTDLKLARYIITETKGPNSFDPLDADATQNLPVARMIYLTPIETSFDDRLASTVLEKFNYDPVQKKIQFVVKSGLKFSDGSPITTQDVLLAILRMAWKRPDFPVIKEIVGIKQWVAQSKPLKTLPEGIISNGSLISISLDKTVHHPLFRFTLELFSIIPSRCINLEDGTVSCKEIPTSGYYQIESKNDSSIVFKKREEFPKILDRKAPDRIQFEYHEPKEIFTSKVLEGSSVAASNDGLFTYDEMEKINSQYLVRSLPRSRFFGFGINPTAKPFTSKICRQYFAQVFRKSYGKLLSHAGDIEGSIFTKIVTGYLSLDELEKANLSLESAKKRCLSEYKANPIRWSATSAFRDANYEAAMKNTLAELGQTDSDPVIFETRQQQDEAFLGQKVHIARFATGLWPLDPLGDLQMLFTPGLHKTLVFQQKDTALQDKITHLRSELPPSDRPNLAKDLNRYIFDDATFNVYRHISRFYVSTKSGQLSNFPTSVGSAAPWQVFEP